MVQNGKNACEMVETDRVTEVRSKYIRIQFFLKVLKFFCYFSKQKDLRKLVRKYWIKTALKRDLLFLSNNGSRRRVVGVEVNKTHSTYN